MCAGGNRRWVNLSLRVIVENRGAQCLRELQNNLYYL